MAGKRLENMFGLIGKKIGMTQIFNEEGKRIGVTVLEAGPCSVLAIKEKSLQLGFDDIKEKKVSKPLAGYFKNRDI